MHIEKGLNGIFGQSLFINGKGGTEVRGFCEIGKNSFDFGFECLICRGVVHAYNSVQKLGGNYCQIKSYAHFLQPPYI